MIFSPEIVFVTISEFEPRNRSRTWEGKDSKEGNDHCNSQKSCEIFLFEYIVTGMLRNIVVVTNGVQIESGG